MSCNIRTIRYNRLTKPLALLVSISLLLSTTVNSSAAAFVGTNSISHPDNIQLEIVDCSSADKLSSTVADIKDSIEKMFSGEFECHHIIRLTVQNTEVYAVPLTGRGFFIYYVNRNGRTNYSFIPLGQSNLNMTSPEPWFDFLKTYGDGQKFSLTLPLTNTVRAAFSFLNEKEILSSTIPKLIINLFQKQNYLVTYDYCPCPAGTPDMICRTWCGGGGGDSYDRTLSILVVTLMAIASIVLFVGKLYVISHMIDVSIISPKDDALYGSGECIDFEVAVAKYDYNTCDCTLTSDIDGEIGSGTVTNSSSLLFQRCDLSPGKHLITAECAYKYGREKKIRVMPDTDNITINIAQLTTTTSQPTTTTSIESTTTSTTTTPITTTTISATGDRFTDNGDGTVTDARTGLIWLKNANPCPERKYWLEAVAWCSSLASGTAGLTDGSVAGNWRLPIKDELEGIGTDPPTTWRLGYPSVTWTMPGAPFTDVQSDLYWSSTEYADYPSGAWYVFMNNGIVSYTSKSIGYYVWAVRGGN